MKQLLRSVASSLDSAIEARRVFQANGRTARAFDGQIVGRFTPNGPNAWDTYRFEPEDGGPIRVFPGLEVQVEAEGAAFRMHAKGAVLRVAWQPDPKADDAPRDGDTVRAAFMETCITGFRNARGIGATAFIARTLGV